jgi:hypothetical protein
MNPTNLLLTALLALHRPPAFHAQCIENHRSSIVEHATASANRYQIPVSLLLVTAFSETHLGCDPHEAGGWGAPIDRRHRHTAGGSDQAASSLAWGFRECHTWFGAVSFYRSGRCHAPHLIGYQPDTAMRMAEAIHERVGVSLPSAWRHVELPAGD